MNILLSKVIFHYNACFGSLVQNLQYIHIKQV